MSGNGIEIAGGDRASAFVTGDDGLQHRTAWAGVGDGVLFFDVGGDGRITESREVVFTDWDPTPKDDMAALRARFDTNGDGKLTAADADFGQFKVMVTGPDGSQTARTLSQLGISEINLKTDATAITYADGSQVTGQATFTMGGAVRMTGEAWRSRRERMRGRSDRWIVLQLKEFQETVNQCSLHFNLNVYCAIRFAGTGTDRIFFDGATINWAACMNRWFGTQTTLIGHST